MAKCSCCTIEDEPIYGKIKWDDDTRKLSACRGCLYVAAFHKNVIRIDEYTVRVPGDLNDVAVIFNYVLKIRKSTEILILETEKYYEAAFKEVCQINIRNEVMMCYILGQKIIMVADWTYKEKITDIINYLNILNCSARI